MKRSQVPLIVAFALGAMVLSARADTEQMSATHASVPRPNATMFARAYKCGGEELQCGPSLVKVCNPKNGKCCCATAGTYH